MVSIAGVSEKVLNCLNNYMFDTLQLAYVFIDHDLCVKEASNNWADYGFAQFEIGEDASSNVDFLVGVDTTQRLNLPIVETPSGRAVNLTMIPGVDGMTITVLDASSKKRYREQLQQAANENELLVNKQQYLMAQLKEASIELENKNKQLAEANRLQTSFLSGVSHEFRTPLTSIIGYTSRVEQKMESLSDSECDNYSSDDLSFFETSQNHLHAVNRSSQHLLSLVENLLDHGKLDSNEIIIRPKNIDLNVVFNDVRILLEPLCDAKNIELIFNLSVPLNQEVCIDDTRLRQCLINLIGNAIKFTDQGSVTVNARWSEESVAVSVVDTGLGISSKDLEKIRLPFWQAKGTGKAGTGLGLTITERILELMGGVLIINSLIGVGTEVEFSLPVSIAVCCNDKIQSEASDIDFQARELAVLLVEDDVDIAGLLMLLFAENNVNAHHALNGKQAVEMTASENYDVIFMDLNMPVMDGYQAIKKIRKTGDMTPIVVMSAAALEEQNHPISDVECDAYLVKPVGIEDILVLASELVD